MDYIDIFIKNNYINLKQIAESLKNIFSSYGAVGRVGGDEFAVIINEKMTKEQLEEQLKKFLLDISAILPERTVSCSIGVYHFGFPKSQKELLVGLCEMYKNTHNNPVISFSSQAQQQFVSLETGLQ